MGGDVGYANQRPDGKGRCGMGLEGTGRTVCLCESVVNVRLACNGPEEGLLKVDSHRQKSRLALKKASLK